jgi:hypothetical protein
LKCIKKYDENNVSVVRRKGLGYIATTDEKGHHVKSAGDLPYAITDDEGRNVKSAGELPYAIINDEGRHVKNALLRWLL